MLLYTSGTRNVFRHLAKRTEHNRTTVQTRELEHFSGLPESFDTITCLARLSAEEKERELLRNLWQALNPGGTLILSLACTGGENRANRDIDRPGGRRSPGSRALPYNSELLKSHVLELLGEPKGYTIYGEDAAARSLDPASTMPVEPRISLWRESAAVGRYWRRYSSMSQVRGRGIVAMRFVKSANLSVVRQVS
jgi:SAM-dependent methyltransferase